MSPTHCLSELLIMGCQMYSVAPGCSIFARATEHRKITPRPSTALKLITEAFLDPGLKQQDHRKSNRDIPYHLVVPYTKSHRRDAPLRNGFS